MLRQLQFLCLEGGDGIWILDSVSTFHMTTNKDWFVGRKQMNGGIVYMGNNHPRGVMVVLSLKWRAWSDMLDNIGFSFLGEHGQRGSLICFNDINWNWFYYLDTLVKISDVAVQYTCPVIATCGIVIRPSKYHITIATN